MPTLQWQDAGALGVVRGSCGTPDSPGGLHLQVLINTVTGQEVDRRVVCVTATPNQPNPPPPPLPPPPPPPPTLAEFARAAAALLTVQTQLNPRAEIGGLTGLDTWLWCEDPTTVRVGVSLRGWTAAATMNAAGYRWSIDGTASASFIADSCGSEAVPAASWMPETMGPYSVTLTSTWWGSWTLSYSGLVVGTFPLGPVDFAASPVPYPVAEYRGVLTPPGVDL